MAEIPANQQASSLNPEEKVSNLIPFDKWEAMAERDRLLLTSMGFKPGKEQAEKPSKSKNPVTKKEYLSRRDTAPSPYYLTLEVSCNCCESKHNVHSVMELHEPNDKYLKMRKINPELEEINFALPWRDRKTQSSTCHLCTSTLIKLSKEELIERLMNKYNGVFFFLGGRHAESDNKVAA